MPFSVGVVEFVGRRLELTSMVEVTVDVPQARIDFAARLGKRVAFLSKSEKRAAYLAYALDPARRP